VSELVHEDHEPEDQQRCEPAQHYAISCTMRRAAASAASKESRSSPGKPPSCANARSIATGIRANLSEPSSTRATAASLAALNTAGAAPPCRPAAMPNDSVGNTSCRTGSKVNVEDCTGS